MQLAASKGIKVLLDGQGSDEMLGGYMHSFYRLIGGAVGAMNFGKAYRELDAQRSRQELSGKKTLDLLLKSSLTVTQSEQDLYEMEYLRYFPFLQKDKHIPFDLKQNKGTRLNQFLYQLMTTTSLPTLLQFEDRNSMAFSIESRVPFLDHRLVEFIFSLGDDEKIKNAVTKKVLRDGMRGILPDAIADRKDKKGFVTPGEVKWLRGPLAHLLEQDFSSIDFLQQEKVNRLIADFKSGDNKNANLVWRVAVLKYWMMKNGS
jgi:asparagine synthase (glutamine-hydrolysing)